MDAVIRSALKSQYKAALETVRDAINRCPEDLWEATGPMPQFWQIAYHAVFFAHFYMVQGESAFTPWNKHRRSAPSLEPDGQPAYTKVEVLEYLDLVVGQTDSTIDGLDLATSDSGYYWYPIPKLDHEILNIRHIMEHAGQLDAILRMHGQKAHALIEGLAGDRSSQLIKLIPSELKQRIETALSQKFPSDEAYELTFHLTDWNNDFAFLCALYLFPDEFTNEEIWQGIEALLIHAPNHLAAAAQLFGYPVTDVFELGVTPSPEQHGMSANDET